MTFGEKLKDARKEAGLSQEQLAERLSVSRSAVAKWESDTGMPDVGNLKAISKTLSVSIDQLLADDDRICFNETREPVDLDSYVKTGKCRDRKDAAAYAGSNRHRNKKQRIPGDPGNQPVQEAHRCGQKRAVVYVIQVRRSAAGARKDLHERLIVIEHEMHRDPPKDDSPRGKQRGRGQERSPPRFILCHNR